MLNRLVEDTARAVGAGRGQARRLIEDVVRSRRARVARDEVTPVLEFMQFYVGTRALESAIVDGELNEAADWIMWSLADQILDDQAQELEVGRVLGFLDLPLLHVWPRTPETITEWLTNFFYYARRRAAMRNVGESLWGLSRAWLNMMARPSLHATGATLAAMLLGWAAQENGRFAAELTPAVERWATNEETPPRSRAILVLALATRSGRFSSVPSEVWAHRALADLGEELWPHERLQVIIEVLHHRYDDDLFQEALRVIDLIPPRSSEPGRTTVADLRSLDSMPDLGLALSTVPLLRDDINGLVAVLEHWYRADIANGRLGPENTLVFAPFHVSGFRALEHGRRLHLEIDTQQPLERLVAAANAFANTSTSVVGADNSVLHVPDRFGVPDEAHAAEFEAALIDAYCPTALAAELTRLPSDGFVQLLLGAKPHPIQAIQLSRLGRTWPIAASLQCPQPDRTVRRVVVWSGAGSMSEALEVEAIRTVFERQGATVEVHAPEVTTIGEFLRVYRDPMTDVMWVVSHGEYDHWAPKNVAVQIGRSQTFIQLDHLLDEAPKTDGRRLMVFNVCDGGRFEELGALPRIGFAPALAESHQAVISQMWPVKGWAAAAFGTLLAGHLASGRQFFGAFTGALATLRCPREELAQHIADTVGHWGDLCERVARSGDDFENFALSGSAAFFQ